MPAIGQDPAPCANRLLTRLPKASIDRLQTQLRQVPLRFKQILFETHSPVDYVYFPISGVASVLTIMASGESIEVGNVGREGAVGAFSFLGEARSPNRIIVQTEGEALGIAADQLKAAAEADDHLRSLLLKYVNAFQLQVCQSVACNGLHSIPQRCCRWLLMTHDRLDADQFYLPHEFLATMLGVRRAGVTEALQGLKEQDLITYARGTIKVLDRRGLEAACCECYPFAQNEFERLLA